jgi:hypothetical protein
MEGLMINQGVAKWDTVAKIIEIFKENKITG